MRAYVCPEAEAKQIQKRVEEFVKAVQQGTRVNSGESKRSKVVYSASNTGFRTVTFGFTDSMGQNQEYGKIWYGQGWLFYFKSTSVMSVESFPSAFLMEVGKRASVAPKDAKKK